MKTDTAKIMLNMAAERLALCVKVVAECGGMTPEEAEAFAMEGYRVHGNIFRGMTLEEVQKVKEKFNDEEFDCK